MATRHFCDGCDFEFKAFKDGLQFEIAQTQTQNAAKHFLLCDACALRLYPDTWPRSHRVSVDLDDLPPS